MNGAHLHLMINHLPVIGVLIGVGLLAFGAWKQSAQVTKAALSLFVILAVAGVIVYLTGEPAEEIVERLGGISDVMLESHEEAALVATIVLGAYGVLALGLLWKARRDGGILSRQASVLALVLALAPAAAMGYTANLGGHIRHTEIDGTSGSEPVADEEAYDMTAQP